MSQDAIIEKIKKLLRMQRGGTQGEIENALAMAAELARKHGIDLNLVNPDEEKSEILTHHHEILKLRLPLEAKLAAAICVNFFNVQVCHTPGGKVKEGSWTTFYNHAMTFVGTAWDIEVARYVFVFLQRHFRQSWNHRPNRRLKNREAFLHGMFKGLFAKLYEAQQKESGVGLVLVGRALERRKNYLTQLFPEAKDQNLEADDSDAMAARYAGWLAGRDTNIRPAVEKAPPPAPKQLEFA